MRRGRRAPAPSGARIATTPVGSGTVKSKYGPETEFEPPSTCASLSAQPAYQIDAVDRSVDLLPPEQVRSRSPARVSSISASR